MNTLNENVEETQDAYIEVTDESPFDKGFWMMWQCSTDENGRIVHDHRRAIEYFVQKYNRVCQQIAIAQKTDIDGVDVADISVPAGQIWVR